MAAPIDDSSNQSQIDFFSSNFDPLSALYSNTDVPCPNVKVFNNVAEYESNIEGRNKKHAPRQNQNASTSRIRTVSRINVAPDEPVLEMPNENMPAIRRRMLRNVLTRMDQSFLSGPLSILRMCVQEKLKAHIWTRSARSVRGILKGYIVAFDKHFNIALIDVDEIYKDPRIRRTRKLVKVSEHDTTAQGRMYDTPCSMDLSSPQTTARPSVKSRLTLPHLDSSPPRRSQPRLDSSPPRRSQPRLSEHSKTRQSDRTLAQRDLAQREALPYEATWLGVRSEFISRRHVNQLFIRGDNVVCVNLVNVHK